MQRLGGGLGDGYNGLCVEAEAVRYQGLAYRSRHLQFMVVLLSRTVLGPVDHGARAAASFRYIAGHVRLGHGLGRIADSRAETRDSYAGTDLVTAPLPFDPVRGNALDQLLTQPLGHLDIAVAKQQTELVPAESREYVIFAQAVRQGFAQLAQERVTGSMARGIVDDLEAIEIDVAQGVLAAHRQ